MAEHKAVVADLEQKLAIDQMTGLLNRDALNARIQERIERAEQSDDDEFGMIYLDITRLKTINDTLGHNAGDEFIESVAELLNSKLRSQTNRPDEIGHETHLVDAIAGRLGGDEFAILLDLTPPTPRRGSVELEKRNTRGDLPPDRLNIVIRRLQEQIAKLVQDQPEEARKLGINIALGGAAWQKGMSGADLKKAADEAMRENKKEQHNQNLSRLQKVFRGAGKWALKRSGMDVSPF